MEIYMGMEMDMNKCMYMYVYEACKYNICDLRSVLSETSFAKSGLKKYK